MSLGTLADVTKTKQDLFATNMLAMLTEQKGSNILDYAEYEANVQDGGSYTFYRMKESTVGTNELNMYADGYTGNAGQSESYKVEIDYVYASDKIKAKNIKSTSLDLGSTFLTSLTNAMKRSIDKKVFDTIQAITFSKTPTAGTNGTLVGDGLKTLDDEANVNALIQTAVYASTLAKETGVGSNDRGSVALVVDAAEFAILHRAEKITNANYATINNFQRNTLFGCDVVKVAAGVKTKPTGATGDGAVYIIPKGAFGAASWEGDVEAKSWFDEGQDSLFCKARRSIGVTVIEPESIFALEYKSATE